MRETLKSSAEKLRIVPDPKSLTEHTVRATGVLIADKGTLYVKQDGAKNQPAIPDAMITIPFAIDHDLAEKIGTLSEGHQREIAKREGIDTALSEYWDSNGKPPEKITLKRLAGASDTGINNYLMDEGVTYKDITAAEEKRTIRQGRISKLAHRRLQEDPRRRIAAVFHEHLDEDGNIAISQKELIRLAGANDKAFADFVQRNGIDWNAIVQHDASYKNGVSKRKSIEEVLFKYGEEDGRVTRTQVELALMADASQQRVSNLMIELGYTPKSQAGRKRWNETAS